MLARRRAKGSGDHPVCIYVHVKAGKRFLRIFRKNQRITRYQYWYSLSTQVFILEEKSKFSVIERTNSKEYMEATKQLQELVVQDVNASSSSSDETPFFFFFFFRAGSRFGGEKKICSSVPVPALFLLNFNLKKNKKTSKIHIFDL